MHHCFDRYFSLYLCRRKVDSIWQHFRSKDVVFPVILQFQRVCVLFGVSRKVCLYELIDGNFEEIY